MSNARDFSTFLKSLPQKPGVYQFWNAEDELIYIGKAKSLKSRVSSYFVTANQRLNAKTRVLVSKIVRISFTLVDTEIDAWLLENSLIKKHQPRYNVLLKDDKTYPWIVIKNERFPRIFSTRRVIKDGSTYFGPYASIGMMYTILGLIKEIYPLRTCNLTLSEANVAAEKFKVCLEYQIGNCKGPCQALQSEADYNQAIEEIKDILTGKISSVIKRLNEELKQAVSEMQFERAQSLKEKLDSLVGYQSKSTVVSAAISNIDVFSIASENNYAFVNYLKVMNGTIIQTQTIELRKKLDETEEELLSIAISDFRARFNSQSKEIIVPFALELQDENIRFTVPKLGEKKKLLELSQKNVLYFKKERLNQYEKLNPEVKTERVLTQMMKDLRLNQLPTHIECFDNSNLQGTNPVSAMVCFMNSLPSKKDYRIFTPKTVEGPDDFATMHEVITRRYTRLLEEEAELPDLIIVDGGKGQLSSACDALKAIGLYGKIPIIGIAKRLEEIYFPEDSLPLYIDKKSESLKLIQQLRDEAHRFGITAHRNKRSKNFIVSQLETMDGIGKLTAAKLLKTFGTVAQLKEASEEDLAKVLGKMKALKFKKQLENL